MGGHLLIPKTKTRKEWKDFLQRPDEQLPTLNNLMVWSVPPLHRNTARCTFSLHIFTAQLHCSLTRQSLLQHMMTHKCSVKTKLPFADYWRHESLDYPILSAVDTSPFSSIFTFSVRNNCPLRCAMCHDSYEQSLNCVLYIAACFTRWTDRQCLRLCCSEMFCAE